MEDAENFETHEMDEIKPADNNEADDETGDDDFQDAENYENAQEGGGGGEIAPYDSQIAETSFIDPIDSETLDRIVNNRENETLKKNVKLTLDADKNEEGEVSGETLKNALIDGISDLNIEDRLVKERWDDKACKELNLEELEKLKYRQKLGHINQALENDALFIGDKDPKAYELLENFEESYPSEEGKRKGDVNGYIYENERIIKRVYATNDEGKRVLKFAFMNTPKAEQVKDQLEDITRSSFKDQISSLMGENEAEYITRETAEDYMEELREKEKLEVRKAKKLDDLKEVIKEINTINEEIDEIKQNNPVKIDQERFLKALRGKAAKFLRTHKSQIGLTAFGGLISVIGSVLSTIGLKDSFRHGLKKVGQIGELVEKTRKNMKLLSKRIGNYMESPLSIVSDILRFAGYGIKESSQKPLLIATILIVLVFVYIIKWNVRSIRLR